MEKKEVQYNVSGKDKLKDKNNNRDKNSTSDNLTQIKAISERLKETNTSKVLKKTLMFSERKIIDENEQKEANIS